MIGLAPQYAQGSLDDRPIRVAAPLSILRSTGAKVLRTVPIKERTRPTLGSRKFTVAASPRRFFAIAHASASEPNTLLDIAQCCGFDGLEDRAVQTLVGRVAAVTTALVRRRYGSVPIMGRTQPTLGRGIAVGRAPSKTRRFLRILSGSFYVTSISS